MTESPNIKPEAAFSDPLASSAEQTAPGRQDRIGAAATDGNAARARAEAEAANGATHNRHDAPNKKGAQQEAADSLEAHLAGVANALRDTDLSAATRHISRFARENPVLFLSGAALAGFAAARFLKTSAPEPLSAEPPRAEPDPWVGHLRKARAAPRADIEGEST